MSILRPRQEFQDTMSKSIMPCFPWSCMARSQWSPTGWHCTVGPSCTYDGWGLSGLYNSPAHDAIRYADVRCSAKDLEMVEPRIWPWLDAATEQEWTATPATELQLYSRNVPRKVWNPLVWQSSLLSPSYYLIRFFPSSCGRWVLATYCIFVWLGLFFSSLPCSHCSLSLSSSAL